MIGFHTPSPLDSITHYSFQDEEWEVNIRPRGDAGAIYSNRHAHAHFGTDRRGGEIKAEHYIEHPGDISIFARLHLSLDHPLTQRATLSSAQVREILAARAAS